ncbi:MAG: hypothetical protein QF570_18150 [Myxococcota bacterium]|nr:hypothetical protein [Myxococcota bacterium]
MKVLALDFDGVISDSAPECFWVAVRTLERVRPGSLDASRLERWSAMSGTDAREAIQRDPLFAGFLDIMPLGNRAEDFGVSLLALEAGESIENQADYDRWFAEQALDFTKAFHEHFYDERAQLRAASEEDWGLLMSPYGELIDLLRRHRGACDVVIATAKDRDSVSRLVSRFEIGDVFALDRIYDKEWGRDKQAHIRAVQGDFDVPFEDITFIDDKANHLVSVAKLGARCVLASWGYNGPRERAYATDRGLAVYGLDKLEGALFA